MSQQLPPTFEQISAWLDATGPVALHLNQKLVAVEGEGGVIFPPTYADIKYNIDTLADGTKVALIDSVGSQANRIEPHFKEEPYSQIVPQITIRYGDNLSTSLLDVGHRLGDAIVRCSPPLGEEAHQAFVTFGNSGHADALAKLSPTSLVFGVWDSRDTMAKVPRVISAVIRAWDVDELTRSAQYNPAIDYKELDVFSDDQLKKEENQLANRGFLHVPSVGDHGGIYVRGTIERHVTINLVALRRLLGKDTAALQQYILGISLTAATIPCDPFLRQGCLLVPDFDHADATAWSLIQRNGSREDIMLAHDTALSYASHTAQAYGVGDHREVVFNKKLAQGDVKQKK